MKPLNSVAAAIALCICGLTHISCGGRTDSTSEKDSTWVKPEQQDEVISYETVSRSGNVDLNYGSYHYTFTLAAVDSLPIVYGADGTRYHDNSVVLTVEHAGSIVLQKRLTKQFFKQHVANVDDSSLALVGFSYNLMKTKKRDNLYFLATVGSPDESLDINHTIEIVVDPSGGISMHMAEDLETEPLVPGLEEVPNPDNTVEE